MKKGILIPIAISSCLLGKRVRYDGTHRYNPFIVEVLGKIFRWIPFCPEEEAGLGVPREPLHLVEGKGGLRIITVREKRDLSDIFRKYMMRKSKELERMSVCGFILKSKSPSCGLRNVAVYNRNGDMVGSGSGVFSNYLSRNFSSLPLEEESAFKDPVSKRNFIYHAFLIWYLRHLQLGQRS